MRVITDSWVKVARLGATAQEYLEFSRLISIPIRFQHRHHRVLLVELLPCPGQ